MKYSIVLLLSLLTGFSCQGKSVQQSSPKSQDSVFTKNATPANLNKPFVVDSLDGYSVRIKDRQITVLRGQEEILYATAFSASEVYSRWARELDSVDLAKGFAMALALSPPVGDADNCSSDYSIDSTMEYRNRFNLRCFRIWARSKTSCEDGITYSSRYQGFYVDLSQGDHLRVIQIPAGLDHFRNKEISKVSQLLLDNISYRP